jgi:prepilin signal peptidase PulO-like enzyme (type II secretory pathway)
MNPWWVVLVATIVYGCVGFLSIQLSAAVCNGVTPFDDGPKPGRPPVTALVAGAGFVGLSLALRGAQAPQLVLIGLLLVPLVACWYSDIRCGIVPDYFTLIPLGLWLVGSLLLHNTVAIVGAVVMFLPFALFALLSKGRGMGWGDVKLAALGGAVLGPPAAMLAFAGACLIAVFIAALRKRRSEPIAFAPYLCGAIAASLALPLFPAV